MKKIFELQKPFMEKTIYCEAIKLDEGISVTLAGGDKAHIGAVSMVGLDGEMSSYTFPGHKETIISEKWAKEIYAKITETVLVSVGIHYDNISKADINKVLSFTDELLIELLNRLS